jgi:hypothetical protein
MSKFAEAFEKAEKYATTRQAAGAKQKCPLMQTGLIVLVMRRDNEEMIQGVTVDLKGISPGNQPTDGDGMAKFDDREAGPYTITPTLPTGLTRNFGAPAAEQTDISWERYQIAFILVDRLARPKIELTRQDGGKPVRDVGVRLNGAPGNYDFGRTSERGLAEWDRAQPGLKPATYEVAFDFKPSETEYLEVVNPRSITLPPGSEDTFPFLVRSTWVEFVIKAQFDQSVSGLDYVLTFPDGTKTKSGELKEDGKVREPGPSGTYKFALKLVVEAAWKDPALEVEKEATLCVWAAGYDPGTEVTVEIFDACGLSGKALDTLKPKLTADYPLEVKWTPTAGKLEKLASSSLLFTARVGKSVATSGSALVNIRQQFEVKDPDGKVLQTPLILRFADGTELPYEFRDNKYEALVPWGQHLLAVELPDHTGRRADFKDDGGAREILLSGKTD